MASLLFAVKNTCLLEVHLVVTAAMALRWSLKPIAICKLCSTSNTNACSPAMTVGVVARTDVLVPQEGIW